MTALPKITGDLVADLVLADDRSAKLWHELAKAGYAHKRVTARVTRTGHLVVRIVWRKKARDMSSSFVGAFRFDKEDITLAMRRAETVRRIESGERP